MDWGHLPTKWNAASCTAHHTCVQTKSDEPSRAFKLVHFLPWSALGKGVEQSPNQTVTDNYIPLFEGPFSAGSLLARGLHREFSDVRLPPEPEV